MSASHQSVTTLLALALLLAPAGAAGQTGDVPRTSGDGHAAPARRRFNGLRQHSGTGVEKQSMRGGVITIR